MDPEKKIVENKWFLPDDSVLEPAGPFSTEQIREKIKSGELKPDDFIYLNAPGETAWRRIWEFAEFITQFQKRPVCPLPRKYSRGRASEGATVTKLAAIRGEYGENNLYRRYPRIPFSCQVIVHDQKQVIYGSAVDISEMGISFHCDELAGIGKGAEVVVTVRGGDSVGTFSAKAVVIRAWNNDMLALYFLNLNPKQKRRIAKFVLQSLDKMSSNGKAG